jgi:HEAT repeat protein
MANDIGRAMARLKHRDIRTRRRAVRTLFEHDDPNVLEAFKPLLDDEDGWFVSKALDAYRQWAVHAGPSAVSTLLEHRSLEVRRAGANLLFSLGEPAKDLALSALLDKDSVVQKKAARALLTIDESEIADRLFNHPNDAVRLLGMKHPSLSHDHLKAALHDGHDGVRSAALDSVLRQGVEVDMESLIPFLQANLQTVSILAWVGQHAPDRLNEFTPHLNRQHLKSLSDHLRENAKSSDDAFLSSLLESGMLEPVARWVLRQGASEDELRWQLIKDERLDIIERSKLLERLIGRANEPSVIEQAKALLDSTDEELLKVACENLSTAASEVSS